MAEQTIREGTTTNDRIELVDVYVDEAITDRARAVLESKRYVKGPVLERFENEFASFCDTEHAVGVSSGTAALYLAMASDGIGPGDDVLVPGHTFFASASPVLALGARPVFVDCDPETYTIDVNDLATKVADSDAPTAVVPVHLYGQPAEMGQLDEIASRHDLTVVEDACQAHGAWYRGDRVGSLGDVGCFSFYPSKNMTVGGDGGMLVTDDTGLAEHARELRNHGRNAADEHVQLGLNHRLNELNAAIGIEQLAHLPEWNRRRRSIAAQYTDRLSPIEAIRTPTARSDVEHVYHLYVIDVPDRDELQASLDEQGIETDVHYPTPAHRHPAIERRVGETETLTATEQLSNRILSLPMHPRLTDEAIDRVCGAIEAHYQAGQRTLDERGTNE